MENTSDSFMPRPLLFCLKSGRSVCYSVPDNSKEIKREKGKDRKGILQKTLLYMKGLCEGMEQRSERMIQMIENIGNMPSQKPKVNWQERIHPKTNEGQPFPERGK